jgi:hypothetical protein
MGCDADVIISKCEDAEGLSVVFGNFAGSYGQVKHSIKDQCEKSYELDVYTAFVRIFYVKAFDV